MPAEWSVFGPVATAVKVARSGWGQSCRSTAAPGGVPELEAKHRTIELQNPYNYINFIISKAKGYPTEKKLDSTAQCLPLFHTPKRLRLDEKFCFLRL